MPSDNTTQKAVTVGQLAMLKDYGDSTYATKEELAALTGPTYDGVNHGIVMPSTSKATYGDGGITFT